MIQISREREVEDFSAVFDGKEPREIFFSPGRVNIIGEHLDYNGGYVFPAAISLGITAYVRFRDDAVVHMRSRGFDQEISFSLDDELFFDEKIMWGNYPRGVFRYLREAGYGLRGCDIFFSSTLPGGSGLSSSAAMEVLAGYIMIHDAVKTEADRISLALLCQRVENEFIGVQCGIMDQFAVAVGMRDHCMLLNAGTMEYRHVPLRLDEYVLVIMNSNKPRALADSKYNERRGECDRALEFIRRRKKIDALAAAETGDLDAIPDEKIRRRARHVITENGRVLESVRLLKENRIDEFGALLTASHRSLQHDYEVTGRELDALVDGALGAEGCIGARMTGAGFGGCAIALVSKGSEKKFIGQAGGSYYRETGITAGFYAAEIVDGVMKVQ